MFRLKTGFRFSIFVWILLILPVLIQMPALTGFLNPDPSLFVGNLGDRAGIAIGWPFGDPNVGYQGQALGKLSADQWLSGQLPWWNAFNGVGLPLAAEMQPASLFLPFVLLYHFRAGGLWVELLLQIIAGLSTYGLLRKLKLVPLAAFVGGVLFELNGTFAWHGAPITSPVAFLPMLLLGVEALREKVGEQKPGGWFLIPLALAWSIYSGFPETAYISGLLVGAWILARLFGLERQKQLRFTAKLGAAALVGLLCSLPQLIPFAEYLAKSDIGGHAGAFAHMQMPAAGFAESLMPWLYGPITGYFVQVHALYTVWGDLGGYFTALQLAVALIGVVLVPRKLSVVLLAWMLVCLAKSFDWYLVSDVMNALPLVKSAEFFRYAPPSWELAGAVLVAFAVDGLCKKVPVSNKRVCVIFLISFLLAGIGIWLAHDVIKALLAIHGYKRFLKLAAAWLIFSLLAGALILLYRHRIVAAYLLALLLCLDACLAFAMPIYSGARNVKYDEQGIAFLQSHLGLQRFYSLGPIAPNYGGYYGIAQINHDQLPISKDWLNYIHKHLDPFAGSVSFMGELPRTDHSTSVEQELRENLAAYKEVGVKYVVSPYGTDPFIQMVSTNVSRFGNKPLSLSDGQSAVVSWLLPTDASGRIIDALSVVVGNYGGLSDGQLTAELCILHGRCASGKSGLIDSKDNASLEIVLDQPLEIPSKGRIAVEIKLTYGRSSRDMAIWLWPAEKDSSSHLITNAANSDLSPAINLKLKNQSTNASEKLVYSRHDMNIYELSGEKNYFETTGSQCQVSSISRVELDADCKGAATLLRREAYYPGWKATINDERVPVQRAGEIFQQVKLLSGMQKIKFEYKPSYSWLIVFGFFVGLFGLLYGAIKDLAKVANSTGV